MSATAKRIADRYLAAAQKNPADRQEIFRHAAYTLMGLAQDPKNIHASQGLAKMGLDFAAAAVRERPAVMDDFTDLLRETVISYNEVGDDPMDLVARRREVHEERTPRLPGSVSIAPESFNRDATLGRSAVIKFQPTPAETVLGILQAQNVAFWQGTKKEAQAMTVDINLGFLPPKIAIGFGDPGPLLNVRPFAEVEYGSDGNRTKIKFDISFGTRLTVVGNYIAVTVGMDPPKPGNPTTQLTCGASIGAFAAPSQAPLISTAYIDDFIPGLGVSEVVPIPLKAVQLLPLQSSLFLGETATLVFVDYGGQLITRVFYKQSDTSSMQPIPITGDVAFIRVFNAVGNIGAANFRLPFQLAM